MFSINIYSINYHLSREHCMCCDSLSVCVAEQLKQVSVELQNILHMLHIGILMVCLCRE